MVLDLIEKDLIQLVGRNVIIFGVDMSSPPHIDDKKKDILTLVKVLHKDQNIHLLQKSCIQSTLLKKIQSFV